MSADRIDPADLLSRLLALEGFEAAQLPEAAITRRAFTGPAPAGFAQELIWMLDRAAPGGTAYNIAMARRVRGRLDVPALRRSLDQIIARHEVFRTTFQAGADYPEQVVHEPAPVDLVEIDAPAAGPDGERPAFDALERRLRTAFDLSRDQLLRATVVRLGDEEFFLLIETNHIVYDGWSAGVLLGELAQLYTAHTAGRTAQLPPVPEIRYRDYAAWERERLQGPRLGELLDYWRGQLADAPVSLDLPTDRPRDAAPRFEGAQVDVLLPRGTLDGIKKLAQEHDATLYMALLAVFHAVLHRWSGQDIIVTGSAIAGRTHPETEGVIGYLANTLVLRSSFEGNPEFGELLDRMRDTCLGGYDHHEVPLEKLVLELRRDRAGTPAPLFQAVLTMQNVASTPLELPGVTLEPLPIAAGATKFDLTLFPTERADGLRLALAYRSDIFDASTARRFLSHLATLLDAVVAAPATRISDLPLLTGGERSALAAWNATAWDEGTPATITGLFEARAAQHPGRAAVVSWDGSLTYAELKAKADAIAAGLVQRGLSANELVGLCLDRSTGMIAALLGVLRAGGVYVPLAPDLPAARLAQLLADTGIRRVVTAQSHLARLPAGIDALCLDRAQDVPAGTPPQSRPGPTDPAYVLFTSGSTGLPKGVVVTHANVVHYTRAIARVLELDLSGAEAGWHCATVSSLAADLGNTAIFPALLSGGTVHVLPADIAMDAARFAEYGAAHPIDLLKITPNHLRALLAGREAADILPRRWLVVGGEACPWDLAGMVRSAGRCRMLNHYGPTETTVGVCTYEIGTRDRGPETSATVPIGMPLPNTRAYVLDASGQEQPVGIPGELFIGGLGVTPGYLNRPDLTAERFVADRWSTDPQARLYRTGDRVRRLESGDLEFLGRADDQVKIRGFRVEPGEVESALAGCAEVRQAVVVAREGADGSMGLVAYVVTGNGVSHASLAELLGARLPDYMVPGAWVTLDAVPLTANGKVDRRALPAPLAAGALPEGNGAAATEGERAMAQLWAEVLKREQIGIHANFFELGGHSLLAIRLLGRIAKQFGVRLPLRSLFDHPTVASLTPLVAETTAPATGQAGAIPRRARTISDAGTTGGGA